MRIYVDTSVIGGCLDKEFKEWSVLLFKGFHEGRNRMVLSDLTLRELEMAPSSVQDLLNDLPRTSFEVIELNESMFRLAEAYIREGAVGLGCLADAQHIAAATWARVDVVVSWNFNILSTLDASKCLMRSILKKVME